MLTSIAGNPANKQRQTGFTYVMVLAAVVITGIVMTVAEVQTSYIVKREREAELLFRGIAYREAIKSYYESGKPVKVYPRTLDDLIKDPRAAYKRHIRALYNDPMTNSDWILIRGDDGGISGVTSSSTDEPFKISDFPVGMEDFEKATSYHEWRFVYQPTQLKTLKQNPATQSAISSSQSTTK